MNEQNQEKLEGMCTHGNNPSTCVICEKEKVAGTLKNKISNFVRKKYKKFVGPTIGKVNTARGKPTAESIASQLENSEPFDMEKFMANSPKDEKRTKIDKYGNLKDPEDTNK